MNNEQQRQWKTTITAAIITVATVTAITAVGSYQLPLASIFRIEVSG